MGLLYLIEFVKYVKGKLFKESSSNLIYYKYNFFISLSLIGRLFKFNLKSSPFDFPKYRIKYIIPETGCSQFYFFVNLTFFHTHLALSGRIILIILCGIYLLCFICLYVL